MPQGPGIHHYHKRTRRSSFHELFVSRDRLKHWFDRIVYFVGAFAIIMTIPQFVEVWVRRNAEGVSPVSWGAYSLTSLFWFIYGVLHKERPLIINYGMWVLLNGLIAIGALLYG